MSSSHMGYCLYTILSPRTIVMLMVAGQKDPHEMAELYSRRILESTYCVRWMQIGTRLL